MADDFDGQASNLVRAAHQSARKLVALVTRHFPGFRDSCVYQGEQVFLYKRYDREERYDTLRGLLLLLFCLLFLKKKLTTSF